MSTRSDGAATEQFQPTPLGDRGTPSVDLESAGLDPVANYRDLSQFATSAYTRTPDLPSVIDNPYANLQFAAVNPGTVSDAGSGSPLTQAGDNRPSEVQLQVPQQMPATENQRSMEFGLLAKAVREGKANFADVEPRMRELLRDADRNGNTALDRERRELQGIDPLQYSRARDRVRDTSLELNQSITSNVSGENRSYARLAAENYMVNPAGNRRELMRLDPTGNLLRDAEAARVAQSDPTFRRVQEIQARTNAELRDSITFRQNLEEQYGRRGQPGDAGRTLQLRSERSGWEQLLKYDRFFPYPRPQ
ncbi:MAG TPA: hypothetical protein EYN91_08625 [Candidatus Melainabacteria bacterium]|nr:hypothetical protein [Candidatus Melainabacteria bacterium]HIN66602.1 hypothetical protein [Candidatus Obscuribacterales bacterium]